MTGWQGVPLFDVLACGKALPFLGDAMHEPRSIELSDGGKRIHEDVDVVAVDRTEVAEAELLE